MPGAPTPIAAAAAGTTGGRDAPRAAYRARIAALRAHAATLTTADRRYSAARMAVFLLGAAVAIAAFAYGAIAAGWLLPIAAGFCLLMLAHERVVRALGRADRAIRYHELGLGRLDDRWSGTGVGGERFLDEQHPYAADLDLFGRGSLFELLCTARTQAGEETLAAWLCAPSPVPTLRGRHAAIDELRHRLDLREDLALLGDDVRAGVEPRELAVWGAAAPVGLPRWLGPLAFATVVATIIAIVGWPFGLGPLPLGLLLLFEVAIARTVDREVERVVTAVGRPARDLGVLAALLARLETERFTSPRLAELRAALDTDGVSPSRAIAGLEQLVDLVESRRNQMFAPIAMLVMLGTQLAVAIERWRAAYGGHLGGWLASVGELEALLALAGHAYENPEHPFPELVTTGPHFAADGIGHPLLPVDRYVANDLSLDVDRRLLIVSGSNMSGKSTLLRTVGINGALALAGGVVRARRLQLSPLAIGASIRLNDSLAAGESRFYAEIVRIRQLMELAGQSIPELFLLDEILHGTNSHDRRIGAEAIIRGLLKRGGIGLVTTHDLALAKIADDHGATASNVHFEDRMEAGKMIFDYRLKPGVVERSNALELMRAVGLEV